MKTYQYSEINPVKGILFALAYLAVATVITLYISGGVDHLADTVNNFESIKGLGFLAGIIYIVPIFFLIKFIYPKVTISTDKNQLTITRKRQPGISIAYNDITSAVLKADKINTLTLYGKANEILFKVHPFNNPQILKEIVRDIITQGVFKQTMEQKKLFKETYEVISYKRS